MIYDSGKRGEVSPIYPFIKRVLDMVFSAAVLAALVPLFLFVCAAVRLDSKGPAFFSQARLGRGGKMFTMHKFRSMAVNARSTGTQQYAVHNDPRITRVGRVLRAAELDELPQLVNIFLGQMSFVGPRPPLPDHPFPIESYSPVQLVRFDVRPGLTGLAQISGRREIPYNLRFELDSEYAQQQSFRLDAMIFFKTFAVLARGSKSYNTTPSV